MTLFVWERPHFLFNRRAVAWTNPKTFLILSKFGSLIVVFYYNFVRRSIGSCQITIDLLLLHLKIVVKQVLKAKPADFLITFIGLELTEINSSQTYARGCPCSESSHWEIQPLD